jgi:hypothetical protein
MNYTVVWVGTAERALGNIWLLASDRSTVTKAAEAVDRALATNPEAIGESRDFNQRIIFSPPLALTYAIHADDRLVRVLRVWRIRPRS